MFRIASTILVLVLLGVLYVTTEHQSTPAPTEIKPVSNEADFKGLKIN